MEGGGGWNKCIATNVHSSWLTKDFVVVAADYLNIFTGKNAQHLQSKKTYGNIYFCFTEK